MMKTTICLSMTFVDLRVCVPRTFWDRLGRLFGTLGVVRGRIGSLSGASWAFLGLSWAPFGLFCVLWECLGGDLGCLGRLLGCLGACWAVLWPSGGVEAGCGCVWARGRFVGASCAVLEALGAISRTFWDDLGLGRFLGCLGRVLDCIVALRGALVPFAGVAGQSWEWSVFRIWFGARSPFNLRSGGVGTYQFFRL